jgi:hypothetical protein
MITPLNISYDFKTRSGALVVDDGVSCDATDVADVFGRIDPEVRLVRVMIGRHQRAVFEKVAGHWVVFR